MPKKKSISLWKRFSNSKPLTKFYVIVGIFTIVGTILTAITFLPQRCQRNTFKNVYERDPVFTELSSSLKILILPFNEIQKGSGYDIGFIIKNRLDKISMQDSLLLETYYLDFNISRNFNRDSANLLLGYHHADIVIYGNYITNEKVNDSKIAVSYVTKDFFNYFGFNLSNHLEHDYEPVNLDELVEGKFISDLEAMLYFFLALFSQDDGDYVKTDYYINKSIECDSSVEKSYFLRGLNNNFLKRYTESISDFNVVIQKDSLDYQAYFNRAVSKIGLRLIDEAIGDFLKTISIFPDHYEAYYNLGWTYMKKNMDSLALNNFAKALSINPNFEKAMLNIGVINMGHNKLKEAQDDFRIALKINRAFAPAYGNLGELKSRLNQKDSALYYQDKAISIDSTYKLAYFNKGVVLTDLKRYEEAIDNLTKCLNIDSSYQDAYITRGVAYFKKGNYISALKDLNKVLGINPRNSVAYLNRSQVYYKQNINGKALADINKAIEITLIKPSIYALK
jgi:tetratricopeptide (TPR) repeat protein